MSNLDKTLQTVKLPIYALFKDLEIELDSRRTIISFDWVKTSTDPIKLRELIPKPNTISQGNEAVDYDDTLYIWEGLDTYSTDYRLYGESYTILLICPPNLENILQYLTDALRICTQNFKKPIDSAILLYVWREYVERIHIYPKPSENDPLDWQIIAAAFETKVRQLPQPPATKVWDELEELLR